MSGPDAPAPVVINVPRGLTMLDGFRFGYGFTVGVIVVALIGMCCSRFLHWIGL